MGETMNKYNCETCKKDHLCPLMLPLSMEGIYWADKIIPQIGCASHSDFNNTKPAVDIGNCTEEERTIEQLVQQVEILDNELQHIRNSVIDEVCKLISGRITDLEQIGVLSSFGYLKRRMVVGEDQAILAQIQGLRGCGDD